MLNVQRLRFQSLLAPALLMILAVIIGLLMAVADYDLQGLLIVTAAVGIIAIFLLPRLSGIEPGSFLLKVMAFGLVLKLISTLIRSWVAFDLYGGAVDVTEYHSWGVTISNQIWNLEFDQISPPQVWGVTTIMLFTGIVYSLIGTTLYGGYIIYALLAFLGSYLFYKAFRTAFPEGDKRLFAILIFLFPSILFWSNGIGKDSLMFLGIGLSAYGCARLVQNRLQGFIPLALGLLLTVCIRPHITAILAIAFVLSFVGRGAKKKGVRLATFALVLLTVGGSMWFLLPFAMDFVGVGQLSTQEVLSVLQSQQSLTYQGGSAFQVMDITKPWTYPMGLITILFRPFPWEAHNLQSMVQSMEGIMFMGIVIWRIKSIGKALTASTSGTYLRYILLYAIAFVFAFSVISNFGILARERCMLLPFVFMLIAYTSPETVAESKSEEVMTLCTT